MIIRYTKYRFNYDLDRILLRKMEVLMQNLFRFNVKTSSISESPEIFHLKKQSVKVTSEDYWVCSCITTFCKSVFHV